jgi:hypothetical protein
MGKAERDAWLERLMDCSFEQNAGSKQPVTLLESTPLSELPSIEKPIERV